MTICLKYPPAIYSCGFKSQKHRMSIMPKLHLLTFADNHLSQYGLNNYTNMAQKLIRQAHEFNLFSKIHFYTAQSLFEKYPEFHKDHGDFINSNFQRNIWRGYGYWIWKPFLIWKTLCEMDEGDVLLYADSGCELHVSGIERFMEYLEIVQKNENKNLFIGSETPIKDWCKMDTVKFFGAEKLILEDDAKEVCPTVLFTSSTTKNKVFFKLYYEACCNYHNVNDSPSISPNIPTFKDHRHDQTIFSILVRQLYTTSISPVPFSEIYLPKSDKSPITIQSNTG